MKIKNKILLVFLLLLNGLLVAQETYSFFVKISDKNTIPNVTHARNGNRKTYVKTKNNKLNKLLNSYEIYSCEKVFKSSKKESLQNIYLIECNDKRLMDVLKSKFKHIYYDVLSAEVEMLHIPGDFGTTGGVLLEQEELNYIRAPEAWDITTGSSDIIIGISDENVNIFHEDLTKVAHVYGYNDPYANYRNAQHGGMVASIAAANTNNVDSNNNFVGMSAIGYNSSIYAATRNWVPGVDTLSRMPGVKVINTAWISSAYPDMYNEAVEDRGVVVVASAGNNNTGTPTDYIYPAAFKNVISVSSIGHKDKTWSSFRGESFIDSHDFLWDTMSQSHQHNDSVDIVAPGLAVLVATSSSGSTDTYLNRATGTSFASPLVSGTIALMFDVNYCIDPKEVETILKLTAVKIDTLPQNIQYLGKLGAGKLDAYEAVKMAKEMADAFGTVEVKNRILYRPWFYKLETAPYEIKMTNNVVKEGSKLKFKARNNIEILSGDYYPSTGGYIDLSIDETLALDCPPPPTNSARNSSKKSKNNIDDTQSEVLNGNAGFSVFPNPTYGLLNIINNQDLSEVSITDITGKTVYSINDIDAKELQVNMSKFYSGIYFVKVKMNSGEIKSTKIIKE